jgi:hypothetical protein
MVTQYVNRTKQCLVARVCAQNCKSLIGHWLHVPLKQSNMMMKTKTIYLMAKFTSHLTYLHFQNLKPNPKHLGMGYLSKKILLQNLIFNVPLLRPETINFFIMCFDTTLVPSIVET